MKTNFCTCFRGWKEKPWKMEVYPECMAQESIQLLCHRQDHHEPPLNVKRLVSTWALPALCTPGMWEQTHLHTVYLAGTMSIICAGNSSTHSCLDDCLKIFGSSPSPPQKKVPGHKWAKPGHFHPSTLQQHTSKSFKTDYHHLILYLCYRHPDVLMRISFVKISYI